MKIEKTSLEGVLIIEPDLFRDPRGSFMETYQEKRYKEMGIDTDFVQDNLAYSSCGALRGLHYQLPNQQAKLVQMISGEVFDVVVDIRKGSPTFGQYAGFHLTGENRHQVFIPEGFAHGYSVLSESATFIYKCSDFYAPVSEKGVLWSDPDIGINWQLDSPLLSDKDRIYPCLKDVSPENLPEYSKNR